MVCAVINLTDAPVTVSSDSYPAAPDFVQPDSGNLHQGLLQQHLWIQKIICSFSRVQNNNRLGFFCLISALANNFYLFVLFFSSSTINSLVWEETVSFAQCHTALCHSVYVNLLLSSKRNSESKCG